MAMRSTLYLVILILAPVALIGQKSTFVNKFAIGIEMDVGHSFPNFSSVQEKWEGTFYPAGGINVLFVNRINQTWITDLAIGITGYALTNKGTIDKYVLDFASPTLSSGISYNFLNQQGQECFVKLSSGFQLGYQGKFIDEFETYSVEVDSQHKVYPYIRPEIGIRRYFNQKMKGSRYKMAYEFGTFFRYNFNTLGLATIQENDFEVSLEPRGNIIGGYFKILFPAGTKRVKIKKEKEERRPPIIYNPRY